MTKVTVARYAMATRFEIILHGSDPTRLRAAGEEALDEIQRLEGHLSLYRPGSQIAQINARAAREPVRVDPALLQLLGRIEELSRETRGAFDITVGPLMRCWGFMEEVGHVPPRDEIQRALERIGMDLVALDRTHCTVSLRREGVILDLGAVGKGYAIERAADIVREAGIGHALLHGGTSTVYGLGPQPDGAPWVVAVEAPPTALHASPRLLATVPLQDQALSVSAVWGKAFLHQGTTYGHVLDPRTGYPASDTCLAAVALPSPTETDALSTALLVGGWDEHDQIAHLRAAMRTLLLGKSASPGGDWRVQTQGIRTLPPPVGPASVGQLGEARARGRGGRPTVPPSGRRNNRPGQKGR